MSRASVSSSTASSSGLVFALISYLILDSSPFQCLDYIGIDRKRIPYRGVEPAVGGLELGEVLLPYLHDLFRRYIHSGQAHPVGLLPELPEALQRTDLVPSVHVQVCGPLRYVGDLQLLDPLRPVGGVARLFLLVLIRFRCLLGYGRLLLSGSRRPHMEAAARTASSSES